MKITMGVSNRDERGATSSFDERARTNRRRGSAGTHRGERHRTRRGEGVRCEWTPGLHWKLFATILAFNASACGLAVSPADSAGIAPDSSIDGDSQGSIDVLVLDAPPRVEDVAPSLDGTADRIDVIVRRDASNDVTDARAPDSGECDPFEATTTCQRAHRIGDGDQRSAFICCNGRCESGSCTRRSDAGVPLCGETPCDLRAGFLCCPRVGCVPRDRNLCP